LREEQDRAFRDSARKDRERIHGRMEEERKRIEDGKRREAEEKREEERREKETLEEERMEGFRMEWRRWSRRALVKPEPRGGVGTLRIAIRLPGGDGRSIRQFSPDDTLTSLYAYVDSQFIPSELPPSSDPVKPPSSMSDGNEDDETAIESQIQLQSDTSSSRRGRADAWWGFKLVLAYPRREMTWTPRTTLGSVDCLKGGAQIVVEKIGNGRSRDRDMTGSSSPRSRAALPTSVSEGHEDEYDTESD
jgi:FAS-associated factor 2